MVQRSDCYKWGKFGRVIKKEQVDFNQLVLFYMNYIYFLIMIVYNLSIRKKEIELGTIVNVLAIMIGGSLGLLFKTGLPSKLSANIMNELALCVLYIGISGSLKSQNTLILILSMVIGVIIGEALNRLKVTNLKVMNFVPVIFAPILLGLWF